MSFRLWRCFTLTMVLGCNSSGWHVVGFPQTGFKFVLLRSEIMKYNENQVKMQNGKKTKLGKCWANNHNAMKVKSLLISIRICTFILSIFSLQIRNDFLVEDVNSADDFMNTNWAQLASSCCMARLETNLVKIDATKTSVHYQKLMKTQNMLTTGKL